MIWLPLRRWSAAGSLWLGCGLKWLFLPRRKIWKSGGSLRRTSRGIVRNSARDMRQLLLLDNNILSKVLRPGAVDNQPIVYAISRLQENLQFRVYVPEIVDYELRRKLLHLGHYRPQARKWAREARSRL